MNFEELLTHRFIAQDATTEDVLATFLPLLREVAQAHRSQLVAPLEGTQALQVDGVRLWFAEADRKPPKLNTAVIAQYEFAAEAAFDVLAERRRVTDLDDGGESVVPLDIGVRGEAFTRPLYFAGYLAWEHELGQHDPLTDTFTLGLILASLTCGLNLNEPADLETFVAGRRNLFTLNPQLHPVLAQAVLQMTELDRRRRPQDLSELLATLENYRDQPVAFDVDLARISGFQTRDRKTRGEVVLGRLKERLFDLSRRNNLVQFRPTLQSVNLTQASIPLTIDIRSVREDQLLIWNADLQAKLVAGKPLSLNKHLNFADALYLPALLDRIITDTRRDQQEFGFAQLRLVACFLSWTNLKEKPVERFLSPLVLLPVRVVKNKGIRDTYNLEVMSTDAEVNPVLRHQFKQLYNLDLPETLDLNETNLDALFDYLAAKIKLSEPAVTLNKLDRPRIDLIHEKAKRRLDQYRRTARVSGRGVRTFFDLDYSYDPANYHPLGVKLFSAHVRTPSSHLRELLEKRPRPRAYVAPEAEEKTIEIDRTFYQLHDSHDENPYVWNFDLCAVTVANFSYRRMSLVRDYDAALARDLSTPSFETTFSLIPRPLGRSLPTAPPPAERFDVVPCDPTQAAAVAEARRGDSYIIQGPPGTGKSQTITNLIADFIARGKRVLFVCEKRAAIDVVYARLRQTGLSLHCSLIHDSQTDKKEFILDLKQTYELLAEESSTSASRSTRDIVLGELHGELQSLQHFGAAMEEMSAAAGLPLRSFMDRCIRLAAVRPTLTPEISERLPLYRDWHAQRERLAQFRESLSDLEPSGVLGRHPLRRLNPSLSAAERPIEVAKQAVQNVDESLAQLQQILTEAKVPGELWSSLRRANELVAYLDGVARLAAHGNWALLDPMTERSREFAAALQALGNAEDKLTVARQATTKWRRKLPPEDVSAALDQARRKEGSIFAWLSPAWWRLRSVLNAAYDFAAHTVRPTWVHVLECLEREYQAEGEWNRLADATIAKFGGVLTPGELRDEVRKVEQSVGDLPRRLQEYHAGLLQAAATAEPTIRRAALAKPPLQRLQQELYVLLTDFEDLSLDDLRAETAGVRRQLPRIPQALSVLRALDSLPRELSRTLRDHPWTLAETEAAIAHRTWEQILADDRLTAQFDERRRRQAAGRLESLYDDWLTANAREIRLRIQSRFREHLQRSNQPLAQLSSEQREFKKAYLQGRRTLEHEFGKSMRYKSIRELVDGEAGQVIRDLKPVWLMSPLSVSDTLPLDTTFFDVVIFDEASQVPLEEAAPSLFRGAQVIVVGDEMQLPPTDFFASKHAESDEDDEVELQEGAERVRIALSNDSFLSHAARNLSSTMLGWHYRSRSESLISFSNWAFYDGRLLTVPDRRCGDKAGAALPPSPIELLLERPVSFHPLPDRAYDNRRNRAEAEYIAGVTAELLKRRTGLTLGIIAFSEAQQEEIEKALQRRAAADDEFRGLLDEELQREVDGQFVGLLVKNLENIQGDERDVILLSVCYGRAPNGKLIMNFGPINRSGGEKRLNVAFSRAKKYMAVVTTLLPEEISNEFNEGANCLKNYLHYARALSAGDLPAARRVLKSIARWKEAELYSASDDGDAVIEQLAARLRDSGFVVDEAVGQSHFRVDLAVRRQGDSEYRLGVLVDTALQYEHSDALEREVLRPRLLRQFGWNLTSVLAKDWYERPDEEFNRILNQLSTNEGDSASD